MIKELIKLSNHLDSRGLRKEADYLDAIIKQATTYPSDQKPETHPRWWDDKRHPDEQGVRARKKLRSNILIFLGNYALDGRGRHPHGGSTEVKNVLEMIEEALNDEHPQVPNIPTDWYQRGRTEDVKKFMASEGITEGAHEPVRWSTRAEQPELSVNNVILILKHWREKKYITDDDYTSLTAGVSWSTMPRPHKY
jgi:hypothetical protein